MTPALRFLGLEGQRLPLIIDGEGEHVASDVVAKALSIAGSLAERGALQGERVAILIEPGSLFIEALFGVWLAGGVALVLSPLHPTIERKYFCEDARVKRVLTSAAYESIALEQAVPHIRADLVATRASAFRPLLPAKDDAALQLYTSGTTGKPKGAVLSHGNLATQQELVGDAWAVTQDDCLVHALPLHHMHGLCIAALTALGRGASVNFLAKFSVKAIWESFARGSIWMAVPTMTHKLLEEFAASDASKQRRFAASARALRLCTSGSSALPVSVGERWADIAGEYPLERFGMTEIGVGSTNPLHGDRRPGTVGNPLPGVTTRIVDDAGNDGSEGELWVAGESVFLEYFERPEANDAAFVSHNGLRYFRTGDTVTKDERGYLRILGRTSVDILKSGGYKLSALEIEEVLREHPSVSDAAVVGLRDEVWGERVVAAVTLRLGASSNTDALLAHCKERLAPYKCPRMIAIMNELPRNALGKVMKPQLVNMLNVRTSL